MVAHTWPLSIKLPGLTMLSMKPEKGDLTSVLFNSTTPRLQSTKSFFTNSPCLAPIFTTSPDVFARTLTRLSDLAVAFNKISGL